MTDDNAPVRRHIRHAHGHLSAVKARREAAQALAALLQSAKAQEAAQSVPQPPPEATP